ncbi:MAG TPA: replication-associated recombination protein A, partial [Chloroflexota bacterium]|nr:replication-associated recombination protein A [Chloroflexota bacterium]
MPHRSDLQADLFGNSMEKPQAEEVLADAPLAARMRPATLDEYVGQEQLIGQGRALRRAIETDRISSFILWGPPGSGKTTLAKIIARATHAHFVGLSAVTAGVADLRKVIEEAARLQRQQGQRTIVLIDEIHRFNKSQQDSVLHAVEQGVVTLIGATTENPSFEVNSALLSRCRVFTLRALSDDQIEGLMRRAMADPDRGLGKLKVELEPEAMKALVEIAGGDARTALNGLELAATATAPDAQGRRVVSLPAVEDALQRRTLLYDKAGEQHYDVVSAFIKSVRGSDPDAAIYWMARMLEAGEDPLFVMRRMVILAAEDIGLADPQALQVAVAAQQAVHFIGMPEAWLIMSEAAIYLATAPKSNASYVAIGNARAAVQQRGNMPVPMQLRNAPTSLMKSLGYGKGYDYSHDFAPNDPRRYRQRYLPDGLTGGFYKPSSSGFEAEI